MGIGKNICVAKFRQICCRAAVHSRSTEKTKSGVCTAGTNWPDKRRKLPSIAAKLLPETNEVIRGKPALRDYWTLALQRIPDLRFTVERV